LGGVVRDIAVKVGDKVSEGALVLTLVTDSAQSPAATMASAPAPSHTVAPPPAKRADVDEAAFGLAYAGPGVRKLARELSVDLASVKGSGDKGRILKEDVEAAAKGGAPAAKPAPAAGAGGRHRSPALAEGRFREVRSGRSEAAGAHQEDFRRQPASQLGDDSARHQS
jgi:pyruvate dehydrogenase E2 component (dihydrolipoamide acetyltransferase)